MDSPDGGDRIKVARSCHTQWGVELEPEEGKWNWTDLDSQMKCMADNGIEPGGLLFGYPAWASKNRPGPLALPSTIFRRGRPMSRRLFSISMER